MFNKFYYMPKNIGKPNLNKKLNLYKFNKLKKEINLP